MDSPKIDVFFRRKETVQNGDGKRVLVTVVEGRRRTLLGSGIRKILESHDILEVSRSRNPQSVNTLRVQIHVQLFKRMKEETPRQQVSKIVCLNLQVSLLLRGVGTYSFYISIY